MMRRLGDVAQARAQERVRPVRADLQREHRRAQDLQALGERVGVEAHRQAVVRPLVPRAVGVGAEAAPRPRGGAEEQRGADLDNGRTGHRRPSDLAKARRPDPGVGRQPGWLGHPATGALLVVRRRRHALLHPRPVHRLVHDPASSPSASGPTSAGTPGEPDVGAGRGEMGIPVRPRPDQALARHARRGMALE